MSSSLARLTAATDKDLGAVIAQLEQLCGFTNEDIRWLAKHRQHSLQKIASLGLDPLDTTAEELHEALKVKFSQDCQQLARAINYQAGDNESRAAKLVELAKSASQSPEVFAIKKSPAKNLLRANSPTHLMKKLGYRSLESMLKREDICELFAVLPVTESNSWQKKFLSRLGDLRASDFETRNISYHVMSCSKWQPVYSASRPVSYVPLMGAVTVWPVETLSRPESVGFGLALMQAAEILEIDSLYLKNYQFQPQFGELAARLYKTGEQEALLAGAAVFDWQNLKQLFKPQSSPLRAFSASHPAFSWWKDAGHLVTVGEQLVSTHLADIAQSTLRSISFESRSLSSGSSAVRSSLLEKYLKHEGVSNYFQAQLDGSELAFAPAAAEDSISAELEAGLI